MSKAYTFKCPSCGAWLEYQPGASGMVCPYCSHRVEAGQIPNAPREESRPESAESAEGLRAYHCQNCGAEIVTGATTAASRCYFCHSPVVLTDRLSDEFKPDGVIPFELDRAGAEQAFRQYLDRKFFLDRRFFSDEQRENLSGVYYPYWVGSYVLHGDFEGVGTRISVHTERNYIVRTTRYFRVKRQGVLTFRDLIRKGLRANDRKLSDGIHPYRLNETKGFRAGYLSGFLAERRDVPQAETGEDMLREARGYAANMMRQGGRFDSLDGTVTTSVSVESLKYVLLPTWVLTYRGRETGKPFYYMMNGQTGKVCGRLPVNAGKLTAWCLGLAALVTGLLCLGGAFLW